MKKITENTICKDTVIVPEIIAQTIAEDYARLFFKKEIADWDKLGEIQKKALNTKTDDAEKALINYLVEKANSLYQFSSKFNKDVKAKGNKGRDMLYVFMYHWVGMSEGKFVNSNPKSYQVLVQDWEKLKSEN